MELTFTLNGESVTLEAAAESLLVDVLRDHLGLTGTKRGCDTGACGACSVLLDGRLARSCRLPFSKVAGCEVVTIEGIHDARGGLDDVQQAFLDCGAVQCGFCTPGMVLAGEALLLQNPFPTREEIRKAINGNLCRCTGYKDIVDAIASAAAKRQRGEAEHFPVLLEKWQAAPEAGQEGAVTASEEVPHA